MSSAIENLVSLFEIYKNPLKILIILLSRHGTSRTQFKFFNEELVVTPQNVISVIRLAKYLHRLKHLASSTEGKLIVHKDEF